MIKRWIKRLLKVLLALFVLLAVFLLFERVRGQISLARYKQKLIAQGEKLSPQDFVQSFAEADNGAPGAIEAIQRLEQGEVLPLNRPPAMRLMPSGRAIIGFRESEWIESVTYRDGEWVKEKVTNRWDQVAADLKANETTLAEIRDALEKPVLNNHVDLAQGMKMKFQHLSPAKSLPLWLGARSQLALHEGKTHEALQHLLTEVRLPRLLAEDRIIISELVRIAIAAVARVHTWEALQADRWTDEDLAALQKAWESQEFASAMAHTLEGERVSGYVLIELGRQSNRNAVALFGLETLFPNDDSARQAWEKFKANRPFGKKIEDLFKRLVYCRLWRFAWSHQEQRHGLEMMQWLVTIMRDAARGKPYADTAAELERLSDAIENQNLYDKLRFATSTQWLGASPRVGNRVMRAETDRSLTLCAIALKRYAIRHGKYPAHLDALVPEFLAAVPADYMDGRPLKYRLNADGSFTLYSVGEDGKDDGGDTSRTGGKSTRNLWSRRDYVWPSPALPEEVEAYREEVAKD